MRFCNFYFLVVILALIGGVSSARDNSGAGCVSFAEASQHLGTSQCVSGTVLRVENGGKGVTLLSFCKEKDKTCPFSVVVFPADLKKMGDVRQLEGKQIEIKGTIQDYEGRSEIILRRSQQLGESAFLLFPQVPTDYDVEKAGHARAGSPKRAKAAKKTTIKQGEPVSIEDPEQP
jgi:DNA/RNA endonuclease YhcR with UshA esterase domain